MGMFINLEDSPMFHKQICSLEYMTEEIRDRCQKLYRGCKKYITSLGEASNADIEFAETLVAFGGGQDDPVSVSIGGPVISQFITAFRELASYKELLRSQVEHVIVDRLMDFMDNDLQAAKESRRRFEKAGRAYDQSRERFVSLKRNTREDIVAELEEGLQNTKSAFERSRFNLVNTLMSIDAKKKHEFLESISALMDAHFRYFKQGNDLLSQMEPLIHQVLTYAQQSREQAIIEQDKLEKRIQQFRTQAEMDNIRASSDVEPSTSSDDFHVVGMNTYKSAEAIIQPFSNGEVQTIKQGYLLKRSASSRDWKRRFFVLDSQGSLYYYSNKDSRLSGSHSSHLSGFEQNSTVFGRFRSRHKKAASLGEENLACCLIDLRTSTIKVDAEDTDLRLCFRIISPAKTFTLQAENGADRNDWINKITRAIASLLNSHIFQQSLPGTKQLGKSKSSSNFHFDVQLLDKNIDFGGDLQVNRTHSVSKTLREIPGNEFCAECGAAEPDWASLNLGILLCIECSGVHRNLGVHISKVRSLTLDVKVWEATVMELFKTLGNTFCNSVWEGLLLQNAGAEELSNDTSITKPHAKDSFCKKEKFIQAKYVERLLVVREANTDDFSTCAASIWKAVKTNNLREVYRLIALSTTSIVNTSSDDIAGFDVHHQIDASDISINTEHFDSAVCSETKVSIEPENCFQGCSLLHLACHLSNPVMLELLLQFGADINKRDCHGRTPLHYCIYLRKNDLAKFLLRRGARPSIKDGGGLSALERAMEMGAITDDELFILLSECQ